MHAEAVLTCSRGTLAIAASMLRASALGPSCSRLSTSIANAAKRCLLLPSIGRQKKGRKKNVKGDPLRLLYACPTGVQRSGGRKKEEMPRIVFDSGVLA